MTKVLNPQAVQENFEMLAQNDVNIVNRCDRLEREVKELKKALQDIKDRTEEKNTGDIGRILR